MEWLNEAITHRWEVIDFLSVFHGRYPLLAEFHNTPQDKEWHAEGDVETHTNMVLDAMYDLLEGELRDISNRDKALLVLACCFHDYAKPITTKEREMDGKVRIIAPQHEIAAASLLFYLPPPFDLSPEDWNRVIQLVAYHQVPKMLVVRDKGAGDYARLSNQVPALQWLYWLEMADMIGRECADQDEQLLLLDIFKETAQRFGLWDVSAYEGMYKPFREKAVEAFPGIDEHVARAIQHQAAYHYESGTIFMLEEEIARAYQYKDKQTHFVMMSGPPASGKTAFVNSYRQKGYTVISLDDIRRTMFKSVACQKNNDAVVRMAAETLRQCLREKRNVVWDATTYRRDFRTPYVDLAMNYGAFVEIVVLQKPVYQLLSDNAEREDPVTKEAMQDILSKFQLPEYGDAHAVHYVYMGDYKQKRH